MTAARTYGRHIVVIGFGFNKGSSRDAKVRELDRRVAAKIGAIHINCFFCNNGTILHT